MAMKIKSSGFSGWNDYPVYHVSTFNDYDEITRWMRSNGVEHFLLSSGSTGYTFQVKHNHDWFALKWL